MLKTSDQVDEIRGFALLHWWNGVGAVRLLERDRNTILMERATGSMSLLSMSHAGNDAQAVSIICDVLDRLSAAGAGKPPPLIPLADWFAALFASESTEPFMRRGQQFGAELLAISAPASILHGDMHHGNVVQLSSGEWRAIDPQGLLGPRAFDYANIFRNPDLAIAANADCFRTRLDQITTRAGIDRLALLKWIVALCALSHSWGDDTELPAGADRTIAELALAHLDELDRSNS